MSRLFALPFIATVALLLDAGLACAQPTNTTEVTSLTFTPDGKSVLATSLDGTLRRWGPSDGKEKQRVTAHKGGVYGGALSADGKRFATAGGDGSARLWDAVTLKELRAFQGHRGEVVAVALTPDGKMLATGGADKTIRLWDADTGKALRQFHGHEVRVTGLAFAPDGRLLLSGGVGNVVIPGFFINAQHADQAALWDTATGKPVRQLTQRGTQVAFAPDGRRLAVGGVVIVGNPVGQGVSISGGARVQVGPVNDGRGWQSIEGQGGGFAFSADGRWLATTWGSRQHLGRALFENRTRHRRVALWELATGKEVLQVNEDGATAVALSPDGKRLAAGRLFGGVVFFDTKPAGWTADAAAKLTPADLEKCWQDLAADANAQTPHQLLWTLSAAGGKTVKALQDRLQPVKPGGPEAARLIADLDSKTFKAREHAFKELKKLGARVEPELRQALQKQPSGEARRRLEQLLAAVEQHPATPDELRQLRALAVLEWIGDAEAQALLTRLAGGAPGAWLTTQAQDCLQRLRRASKS